MKATKSCSGLAIVLAIALVAVFAATPAFAAAPKPKTPVGGACPALNQLKVGGTTTQTCDLDNDPNTAPTPCVVNVDFACNPSAQRIDVWHFVLNQTTATNATTCGSISVTFANCPVPADNGTVIQAAGPMPDTSGTCFYDIAGHDNCTLVGASDSGAGAICTSGSQFVLSSAPCVVGSTQTVANTNGAIACSPVVNGDGDGCVDIATETTCTPVQNSDLPAKFWDIATTNAPANLVTFKTYETGITDLSCAADEAICVPANLVTTGASGNTGVAGDAGTSTVISLAWFADTVTENTGRAFQACIGDRCGGCEAWPTQAGDGGGQCPTRTRGFYGNHDPCGDIPLPVGFAGTYTQTQRDAVCTELGIDLSNCTATLCAELGVTGGGCNQLGAQLITALLNEQVFTGSTIPTECDVTTAIAAFKSDDDAQCNAYIAATTPVGGTKMCLDTFNNSGDTLNTCVE